MRIVLVGTDLAPVRDGAGALETLLCGWATGLAAAHDVTVVSVARATTPSAVATPARDTPGGRSAAVAPAPPYRRLTIEDPDDLRSVVTRARPDVVVLNNRPGWQVAVDAPTLHLFHNWPDAWGLPGGADAGADQPDEVLRDMLAGASVAAVSRSLAGEVARVLGRPPGGVDVVAPWVAPGFFVVEGRRQAGLVVSPNRLMVKKGVAEVAAVAGHPSLRGWRVVITDHLSPWTEPTAEHTALRALVGASAARLIPPPPDRAAMGRLYAEADVVVCPSIRPEGLGLSALEAQAAGVPTVTSGLGGLREASLLPELIAEPHDTDAFARAILAAARIPPARRAALRDRIRGRHAPAPSLRSLCAAVDRARRR